MPLFDDVLMTVDFDRTLTGPDSQIPQRNLDAIAFFMENGGKFTVNTGRSAVTFGDYLGKVPVNAPILMYNGSIRWEDGRLFGEKRIDLPMWQTLHQMVREFPDMNIEVQGLESHYLVEPSAQTVVFYDTMGWRYELVQDGQDLGPFLKFAVMGTPKAYEVATLYDTDAQEQERFDYVEARINQLLGDKIVTYRAAPRIIDVHAKGVSKGNAARELLNDLGRRILVCVGDAENDISMLEEADYAFCPADATIADRYTNVCDCGQGAIADVIYKKIPEILGIRLDNIS